MKTSPRSQKLAGLVQEHLMPIINWMFTPEDVGFLTVSAIEVSGDLSVGDIFVSSMDKGITGVLSKLNKKARDISGELKKQLKLSKPLKLRFKEDKGVKHSARINQLME